MKKYLLIIVGILLTILSIILVLYLNRKDKPEVDPVIIKNDSFIYLDVFDAINRNDDKKGYVYTNYEEFSNRFGNEKISESDFGNHNYVLIPLNYNPCAESDVTPVDYTINGNDINVKVEYYSRCGVCTPVVKYFALGVDKNITSSNVSLDYKRVGGERCDSDVVYKPIIYIYPEEETEVSVKLKYPELLTTTYPKYINEWKVLAKPNGDLIDKDGKYYYGLYWEGFNNISDNIIDGFIVKGEDTISFLEDKLSFLGLNSRETNEFIIYWLPKLEGNEYNLIRFLDIDEINSMMPLDISPKPDTLIRVLMVYKKLDKKIDINEQKLVPMKRDGFSVIEWGGSELK